LKDIDDLKAAQTAEFDQYKQLADQDQAALDQILEGRTK
jgi:hypothetical protein